MAGKNIFISYRRQDAGGESGRLAELLQEEFQQDRVFMDVDTIEPGSDFVEVINRAVSSCDVMLVMIGPHWNTIKDNSGRRRLDNPDDFVRLEIGAALKRNIRVIPILVNGAVMPSADQLPDDLDALTRRHAHELSSTRWKYDSDQLINLLEKLLGIQRKGKVKDRVDPFIPPKPPKRSWWSKNYIWVLGVAAVIIILLSIPEPYEDSDESYDPPVVYLDSTTNYEEPSILDEVDDNSGAQILPNLNGRWAGVNNLAQKYFLDITQNGNVLNFIEYNHLGIASASGSGTLYDGYIEMGYNSILDFTGDLELSLSPDGRTLDGMIYLPNSTSIPVTLNRSN